MSTSARSSSPELSYGSSAEVEDALTVQHHYCNPMLVFPSSGSHSFLTGPFSFVLMDNIFNVFPYESRQVVMELERRGASVVTFDILSEATRACKYWCYQLHPHQPHSDSPLFRRSLVSYLANDPAARPISPIPSPHAISQGYINSSSRPSSFTLSGRLPSEDSIPIASPRSTDELSNTSSRALSEEPVGSSLPVTPVSLPESQAPEHSPMPHSPSSQSSSVVGDLEYPDEVENAPTYFLVQLEDHRSLLFVKEQVAQYVLDQCVAKAPKAELFPSYGVLHHPDPLLRNEATHLYYAIRTLKASYLGSDRRFAHYKFKEESERWGLVNMLITSDKEEAIEFACFPHD
ncbi:hypothetical protein ONZ45_g13098 [Pleurotus djamor]|nr:hypothetical protein ONZ45_g13098 [Pleurotus djamor]